MALIATLLHIIRVTHSERTMTSKHRRFATSDTKVRETCRSHTQIKASHDSRVGCARQTNDLPAAPVTNETDSADWQRQTRFS